MKSPKPRSSLQTAFMFVFPLLGATLPDLTTAQTLYWDTSAGAGNGTGGSGTWGTTFSSSSTGDATLVTATSVNSIVFQDTPGTITLAANQTVSSLTFNVSGYKISGNSSTTRTITGSISLASNVNLVIGNGETSDIAISLGSSLSGASGSTLTLNGAATGGAVTRLNLAAANVSIGAPIAVTGSGFAAIVGTSTGTQVSSPVTGSGARLNIGATSGNAINFSNTINNGTGTVRIAGGPSGGAGVVNLSGTGNTWGATELNNANTGILRMGVANALPTGTTLTFGASSGNGASIVELSGFNTAIGQLTNGVQSGGTLRNTSATSAILTISGSDSSATAFSGAIQDGTGTGKLSLVRSGTGTTSLSGTNTFTGGVTLSSGGLNLNSASALGTGSFTISGGAIDNTSAGALTLSTNNAQNWNGDFTFIGTKDLNLGTGAVTLGASRTITTTAGNFTVGGVIGDGGSGFGLTKTGAGTLVLSGANTYTGTTTINNGTLKLGASNAIADAVNVVINAVAASTTALFDLDGNSDTIAALTFGGGTSTSTSALTTGMGALTLGGDLTYDATNSPLGSTLSGKLDLGASRTFNIGDSTNAVSDLSVSASIAGSGFSLTKSGAGTLALSGSNTYSGGTTVNAGTIAANSATALGSGITTINSGATVAVGAFTIGSNFTINSGGTLTGTGASSALSGIINGPGGTLAGTLAIASGGSVAPGSSPGLLNITGAVTFNSGSHYTWELGAFSTTTPGTNFDQIVVANGGSLSLLAGATLVPTFTGTATSPTASNVFWTSTQSWKVVTNSSGTGTVTGTAFAVDNSSWSGSGAFATSLANNEVLLTWTPSAIPEPSTYAAIVGLVALGGAVWHRRRSGSKPVA